MKILQINKFYYLKGGSEKHFFEVINMLKKNHHKVIVFSTKNNKNIKMVKSEYFIKEIKMKLNNFMDGFNLFYNYEAVRKLKKIILKERPDIAHLHNISHHFSPAILKVLRKNNIPIVMTVHDYKLVCPNYKLFNLGKNCEKCLNSGYYQCALNKCVKKSYLASIVMTLEAYWVSWKKYYNYVDTFIVPSHFLQNKLINTGYDKRKIKYLPNFLNEKKESDAVGENKNKNKNKEKYILFFGRLSEEKGVDILIKAFAGLENKKVKLKIAGRGVEFLNLQKLSKKLNLRNRIEFLGYKTTRDLKRTIEQAVFVVMPSLWYENAPYSILEAYANKKTVVGSDLGGITEMIVGNKTGLVFKGGSVEDLTKKINYLLNNPKKTIYMGKQGNELLKSKFNQKKYYKNLMRIFKKLEK